MILSKCAICGIKKLKCIKMQEAIELLSNLGLKLPRFHYLKISCFKIIKFSGDKFMP